MKRLFRDRVSKGGSFVSLTTITMMLVVFALALPEFFLSTAGRVFAVVWALLAIAMFVAHMTRLNKADEYRLARADGSAARMRPREREQARPRRVMRG